MNIEMLLSGIFRRSFERKTNHEIDRRIVPQITSTEYHGYEFESLAELWQLLERQEMGFSLDLILFKRKASQLEGCHSAAFRYVVLRDLSHRLSEYLELIANRVDERRTSTANLRRS